MSDTQGILPAAGEVIRQADIAAAEQGRWLRAQHYDGGRVAAAIDEFAGAVTAFARLVVDATETPGRDDLVRAAGRYLEWARNARSQFVENLGTELNHMAGQAALDAVNEAEEAWALGWAAARVSVDLPRVLPR